MEFIIEVPGAANPLTTQNLYNVLLSATSTYMGVKTDVEQLSNWEKRPGFYSSLQSILIDPSLPLDVRHLAVIQLKYGIDKYWRKAATNAIKKEEKLLIRGRSLEFGISEPCPRLALQNALVVSKIIRFEYPRDWPDAVSSIVEILRSVSHNSNASLRLSRTLLLLLYTIKELATGRLMRSRANLQAVAPQIFQLLCNIYVKKLAVWRKFLAEGGGDEGGAMESIEQSLISLRIIRRLIIAGYEFPHRNIELRNFWDLIFQQFGDLFSFVLRNSPSTDTGFEILVERHLLQMAKLHLNMATSHPAGFALLSDPMHLLFLYWKIVTCVSENFGSNIPTPSTKIGTDGDAEDDVMTISEKLCLKGLLILRACVRMIFSPVHTFKYQHPEDKDEKKLSLKVMKESFFAESTVRDLTVMLVTRFFVFRSKDLRDWEEEPEEWEKKEEGEGDSWEYSIRSCAEKLFLDLAINYKGILLEPLLGIFHEASDLKNPSILQKDSIYAAIGLAAPILGQKLDFGAFLESTLVPEVQIQKPGYNIIRRRIAIILGQWLGVKEVLNRSLVYQIFQHLLDIRDPLNDQVVRVTAGRQLKNVIDPFEFVAEDFMPFAQIILNRLTELIDEVELIETKMALVNTITAVVVRMEHHISPFANQLFSLLSTLWAHAGGEFLMKQTILAVLSDLVTSMQEDSQRYHPDIIPLISNSVDIESESTILLEDSMDLWLAMLVYTPSPASEGIKSLAKHLFPLYDISSEALVKSLNITESYVFLMPQEFLVESPRLLAPFASILGNGKREITELINGIVELLIRSAESLGGLEAITHLTTNLISTEFLSTLVTGLQKAYSAHQTTGPNRARDSVDGIVETDYFSILARIALADPSLFVSALEAVIPTEPVETTIAWLLTEWFSHFDNIGYPEMKKLSCLGLTALLASNQTWILSRLQDLMTIWTDTITELVDPDNGGTDCLVYRDEAALKGDNGPEAPDQARRRQLNFVDPVHRLDVKIFVRERLQAAVGACGGGEEFQRAWAVNVDADVLKGFMELGVI